MDRTILIIEDEQKINDILAFSLGKDGYKTLSAFDGVKGLEMALKENPDLILLDVMLPGMDGFEVCRKVREKSQVPIIMLTAREDEVDKVLGLELGADDYIINPFDSKELVARVKAVLRRYTEAPAPVEKKPDEKRVEYKDLIINLSNYEVIYKGKPVEMTPREIELLYFLASSPNQVFTREQLLDHIWGYEYAGDTRTVDVHIKRIREKIADTDQWSIGTVWSVGYRFEVHN